MLEPTSESWLLLSWIVAGAAFLVAHLVNVWQSLSAKALAVKWRVLSLVPPAAPAVAWAAGRRVAPVVWGVLLVTYVVLRAAE